MNKIILWNAGFNRIKKSRQFKGNLILEMERALGDKFKIHAERYTTEPFIKIICNGKCIGDITFNSDNIITTFSIRVSDIITLKLLKVPEINTVNRLLNQTVGKEIQFD
ncbi:MAG: hypothetical protein ACRDD7_13725 [Peptostreptococcaceae bacterium]